MRLDLKVPGFHFMPLVLSLDFDRSADQIHLVTSPSSELVRHGVMSERFGNSIPYDLPARVISLPAVRRFKLVIRITK